MIGTRRAPHILIVDDEALFRDSVVDAARAVHPDWILSAAANGREALDLLRREAFDVLVTDLKMPELDGLGLLSELSASPQAPRILVISAYATESVQRDLRDLGALACLDKPVDLPRLFAAIAALLAAAPSAVTGISISGFVQLLEIERKTCQLRILGPDGVADLVFEQGRLVDAECGFLDGNAAAYAVFAWDTAPMVLLPILSEPARRITEPLRQLLLEAAQRDDEADLDDLFSAWDDEAAANAVTPLVGRTAAESPWGKLQARLARLMEIEGALGIALVDGENGTSLGKIDLGSRIDFDLAAKGGAAIIRSKLKIIRALDPSEHLEDVLMTLDSQYHLLRMVCEQPIQFLYFVLDREGTNLARARQRLADADA